MTKPNLFIVGSGKSGTTALREYLAEHPNIYMSDPKEPCFFTSEFPGLSLCGTLPEYLALFEDANEQHKIVGEASPQYLPSSDACHRIYAFNPDAKIIIMLRNPLEFVVSLHAHLVRAFHEDVESFEEAWNLQNARRNGERIPKLCVEPRLLDYGNEGKLATHTKRFLNAFPKDQVKIIVFEDFVADTPTIYQDILSFLEVPEYNKKEFPPVNVRRTHRIKFIGRLTQRPPRFLRYAWRPTKRMLGLKSPRQVLDPIKKLNSKEQPKGELELSQDFSARLAEYFAEEVRELSEITGRDLSYWLY